MIKVIQYKKKGYYVEYHLFKQTLKENGLTLKYFSELSGVQYGTCSKWGKDGRPVSSWVQSWIALYIENKACKELKQMLKKTVCNEC